MSLMAARRASENRKNLAAPFEAHFPHHEYHLHDLLRRNNPMARKRREMSPSRIKLKKPNRSAPTEETLLQFAQERGLFEQAQQKQQQQSSKKHPSEAAKAAQDDDSGISPAAERIMDTLLWMVSLSMLHFTLDVLVQNQYAVEISWGRVAQRAGQALLGMVQVPVSVANPKTIDKTNSPCFQSSACSSTYYTPIPQNRTSYPASLRASKLPFGRQSSSRRARAPVAILYTSPTTMGT